MLKVGTLAPDFSAKDQDGRVKTLKDYAGNYLLLYFYPRDNTPGCTSEACSFRDHYEVLKNKNVSVVGVSKDSPASHGKFIDRYALPFTLLSDPDKQLMKSYDTLTERNFIGKTFLGTARVSYLIDPAGIIIKVYPKVNPDKHAQQVLADLD